MSEDSENSSEPAPPWTIARVVGYSTIVLAAFFAVQVTVIFVLLVIELAGDSELDIDKWAAGAETDGLVLSLATVCTALVCVPIVRYLVGRREADAWAFLRVGPVNWIQPFRWVLALVLFVIVSDSLSLAIGRPIVPDYMIQIYSSVHPILLLVALVVAAPLFEELFFRGFVLSSLEASGVSTIWAAIAASVAWTAIHTQYEAFELGTIFLMGLLLAAARTKTNSIVPCLAMHSVANAIAFSEMLFLSRLPAI